jgi:hypothetical protein
LLAYTGANNRLIQDSLDRRRLTAGWPSARLTVSWLLRQDCMGVSNAPPLRNPDAFRCI